MPLVTGKKTDVEQISEILEDLIEAIKDLKQEAPVVNVQSPQIVIPEQKAATIMVPEQKAPIVNVKIPEAKKPVAVRCKIVRGQYGEIDYFDMIPI